MIAFGYSVKFTTNNHCLIDNVVKSLRKINLIYFVPFDRWKNMSDSIGSTNWLFESVYLGKQTFKHYRSGDEYVLKKLCLSQPSAVLNKSLTLALSSLAIRPSNLKLPRHSVDWSPEYLDSASLVTCSSVVTQLSELYFNSVFRVPWLDSLLSSLTR